jgi:hypothetical protein
MLIDLTNLPWDETKDVVFSNYFGAPALQTATYVHANVTCPTSDTTTVTTAITNPDVPRNVTIKGNQATVTGNVVINGTDINDDTLTETIASNGTAEVAGAKAFKTVTSFVIPTRGAASDAISIGVGVLLGFKQNVGAAANVLVVLVDRVITAPGAIAVSTTVTASNTIDMSSVTYDATKVIVAFIAGT